MCVGKKLISLGLFSGKNLILFNMEKRFLNVSISWFSFYPDNLMQKLVVESFCNGGLWTQSVPNVLKSQQLVAVELEQKGRGAERERE